MIDKQKDTSRVDSWAGWGRFMVFAGFNVVFWMWLFGNSYFFSTPFFQLTFGSIATSLIKGCVFLSALYGSGYYLFTSGADNYKVQLSWGIFGLVAIVVGALVVFGVLSQ